MQRFSHKRFVLKMIMEIVIQVNLPLFDIFLLLKEKTSKDKISNDGKYECILYGENIYYIRKIESIVFKNELL